MTIASGTETTPEVVIDWLSGFCPVQAEGHIDGVPFYFRARGAGWSLHIGQDPLGDSSWYTGGAYGADFEAGWMDLDEARGFIARSAGLWLESRNPNPSPAYISLLEAEIAWEYELRAQFGSQARNARDTPQGCSKKGTKLHDLSEARDAALAAWVKQAQIPELREENPED